MFRIRFHGRGGQGMKTASRILGTAFFCSGFQVQDAPRYGAERRGAPVFAYVRASKKRINERGVIHNPDLVVIADTSLLSSTPGSILEGITGQTIILINSMDIPDALKRAAPGSRIISIPQVTGAASLSTVCASASASLTGIIQASSLEEAVREELDTLEYSEIEENVKTALEICGVMSQYGGSLIESPDTLHLPDCAAEWTEMPLHDTFRSSPAIRKPCTSTASMTGSWRTSRPVIQKDDCSRCMLCVLYCPDSCIAADSGGFPEIDYNHCKGCMICSSVCPKKAISTIPEHGKVQP